MAALIIIKIKQHFCLREEKKKTTLTIDWIDCVRVWKYKTL